MNSSGTLNINQSLPTFSGGESFQVFGASTYNITAMTIIPATPPGATSWDYTTTPGTLIVVGGGPTPGDPRFTSIVRSGTSVIISGTNGTVNGTYWVLTTNNVASARTNWVSVATNQFDANGNFTFTNPISGSREVITIQQLP